VTVRKEDDSFVRFRCFKGADVLLGQVVEHYEPDSTYERFIYQAGLTRYNTHISSASNYCDCGGSLCPSYVRFTALPITTMTRKYRGSLLDVFATIVGFASGFITLGVPLGILCRFALGRYAHWAAFGGAGTKDGSRHLKLDAKSPVICS